MFILDRPYVSDFLKETIKNNSYKVLSSDILKDSNLAFCDEDCIKKTLQGNKNPLIYTNSENSIKRIINLTPNSDIPYYISIFKDKAKFRKLLCDIFPDFYFFETDFDELEHYDVSKLKFPLVLKPSVGFLSMGVYIVRNIDEWKDALVSLNKEILKFKDNFPDEVLDSKKFIIEQYIEGDEFALDVYFNANKEPVILNIYKHPFEGEDDVKDRIYMTSKKIIQENIDDFKDILHKIGTKTNLKNFPMHIELRKNDKGIIPIEVNPLRFAGWCTCDLAFYAYGINPYVYYMEQKTHDFNNISDDDIFYFLMAEVPKDVNTSKINGFDYKKLILQLDKIYEIRKYDYIKNPLFAVIFGSSKTYYDIEKLLKLDMKDYIEY